MQRARRQAQVVQPPPPQWMFWRTRELELLPAPLPAVEPLELPALAGWKRLITVFGQVAGAEPEPAGASG